MSLQQHKITSYKKSIKMLPDKVQNRAQELKEMFDARTDDEVKLSHNALIDALDAKTAGQSGAENIGFAPYQNKITAQNIQDAIQQTYDAIDEKVIAIGAGDMAKSVYDPQGKNTEYQPKNENALQTSAKNIPSAINEVKVAADTAQINAGSAQTTADDIRTALDDTGIARDDGLVMDIPSATDIRNLVTGVYRSNGNVGGVSGHWVYVVFKYNANPSGIILAYSVVNNTMGEVGRFNVVTNGVWAGWKRTTPTFSISGTNLNILT
jgi:hypothetical protein